jgi:hypothetical protein
MMTQGRIFDATFSAFFNDYFFALIERIDSIDFFCENGTPPFESA